MSAKAQRREDLGLLPPCSPPAALEVEGPVVAAALVPVERGGRAVERNCAKGIVRGKLKELELCGRGVKGRRGLRVTPHVIGANTGSQEGEGAEGEAHGE